MIGNRLSKAIKLNTHTNFVAIRQSFVLLLQLLCKLYPLEVSPTMFALRQLVLVVVEIVHQVGFDPVKLRAVFLIELTAILLQIFDHF